MQVHRYTQPDCHSQYKCAVQCVKGRNTTPNDQPDSSQKIKGRHQQPKFIFRAHQEDSDEASCPEKIRDEPFTDQLFNKFICVEVWINPINVHTLTASIDNDWNNVSGQRIFKEYRSQIA